ncbi:MAG: hypothetical protein C5B49_12795 [Bdellovibrio sp.]|nr:MAG: hypothetical protein C5B49_12795 [Bdellovibrio sp.]
MESPEAQALVDFPVIVPKIIREEESRGGDYCPTYFAIADEFHRSQQQRKDARHIMGFAGASTCTGLLVATLASSGLASPLEAACLVTGLFSFATSARDFYRSNSELSVLRAGLVCGDSKPTEMQEAQARTWNAGKETVATAPSVLRALWKGQGLFGKLGGQGWTDTPERKLGLLPLVKRPMDPQGIEARQVLGSLEDYWSENLPRGVKYNPSTLVIYKGTTKSGCGMALVTIGPFYCPTDRKIYMDFDFYQRLENELRAPGESPRAYVIEHEWGHHIQNLSGGWAEAERIKSQVSPAIANIIQTRTELMADAFAGRWARAAVRDENIDPREIRDILRATERLGDDTLQRRSQGYVDASAFTHGSAEDRYQWFLNGYLSKDLKKLNTFAGEDVKNLIGEDHQKALLKAFAALFGE